MSVYGVSTVRSRRPTTSSTRQVHAISHAHHNDANLPLQDCLLDEGNTITFVVIGLSLPACVSRLPQCQPASARHPERCLTTPQADHGPSAQKPRHSHRIGAPSTRCGNLPLGCKHPQDSFPQTPGELEDRKVPHSTNSTIVELELRDGNQMRVISTFGETHACLPFFQRCLMQSS